MAGKQQPTKLSTIYTEDTRKSNSNHHKRRNGKVPGSTLREMEKFILVPQR